MRYVITFNADTRAKGLFDWVDKYADTRIFTSEESAKFAVAENMLDARQDLRLDAPLPDWTAHNGFTLFGCPVLDDAFTGLLWVVTPYKPQQEKT